MINGLALCAGAGGLELGLGLAIPAYRTVCYVERETYAAAVLTARMAEGWLHPAPIWDDVAAFDGRPWCGVVDIVSAGFPCQPWSGAGQRRGTTDDRWIWPDTVRVIREVGPTIVFLENVPGLLRGGLEYVLGDLASLGFDAEWDVFSAAGVGAPHRRERLFILAHARGRRFGECRQPSGSDGQSARGDSGLVGHTHGDGAERRRDAGDVLCSGGCLESEARQRERSWDSVGGAGESVVNTTGIGRQELVQQSARARWSRSADADRDVADATRPGIGRLSKVPRHHSTDAGWAGAWPILFPPRPNDSAGWARLLAQAPDLEPAICRDADGMAYRLDRLRATGNGVVPAVAAIAFRTLWARLMKSGRIVAAQEAV